jgi:hypothetical protein
MKKTFLIALGLLLAALTIGGLLHSTQPGGGVFDLIAAGLLGAGSWSALKAARGPVKSGGSQTTDRPQTRPWN